jgi:DNA mismatch endonuclease (patch repair protein)
MRKIRGDNLKPERLLAAALAAAGVEALRNVAALPGKPDFLVGRLAVFVDGCFWHGCPRHFRAPKTRTDHWVAHVGKNKARDKRVRARLRRLGFRTVTVWEHDLKTEEAAVAAAERIERCSR